METGEEEDSEEGDDNKPEKDLDDKKILESPPSVHTTKVQIVGATSDENQVRNICSEFFKTNLVLVPFSVQTFYQKKEPRTNVSNLRRQLVNQARPHMIQRVWSYVKVRIFQKTSFIKTLF